MTVASPSLGFGDGGSLDRTDCWQVRGGEGGEKMRGTRLFEKGRAGWRRRKGRTESAENGKWDAMWRGGMGQRWIRSEHGTCERFQPPGQPNCRNGLIPIRDDGGLR